MYRTRFLFLLSTAYFAATAASAHGSDCASGCDVNPDRRVA